MGHELAGMVWAQVWQVSLLILSVGLAGRWIGRNHPHLAHALWVVVLVKAITPPIWSSPSGIFSWVQPPKSLAESSVPEDSLAEMPVSPSVRLTPADLLATQPPEETEWIPIAKEAEPVPAAVPAEDLPADFPPNDLRESQLAEAEAQSPAIAAPLPVWMQIGLGLWLVGSIGALCFAWFKWLACWREIKSAEVLPHPQAEKMLEELLVRLKVRHKVRLRISQSRIGPAVLGLFRPTVLLPARILEGQTPADLEPILAHELIHVRRGDLWVSWLQVLVQSLWWFHPLIWWAGRLLKQEAERSCDEEVVAELGCKPARYARALLNVLELKQILKPVPVLPGVKPVEITSQRLERIMLLGQGCHKRTPWWCWLVMVLTAALTLPGAAFVASAKDKTKRRTRQQERSSQAEDTMSRLLTRTYKVGDVLDIVQRDEGLAEADENAARKILAIHLKAMLGRLWQGELLEISANEVGTPGLSVQGNTLTVHHTQAVQDEIAHHLKLLRKHGLAQIVIETRILSAKRGLIEKHVKNWISLAPNLKDTHPGLGISVDEAAEHSAEKTPGNRVQMTVKKNLPARCAILDDPACKTIIQELQSDARSNLMFCPKVTVFNGQRATIQDITQRPFVVHVKPDADPTIRVVSEGISIQVQAELEEQLINLASQLTISDIRSVDVFAVPGQPGNGAEPPKVQVPEVATTRIQSTVKLPDGGTVLLGGISPLKEKQPDVELFIMLRVQRIQPETTRTGRLMFGQGVNSDAGVTGNITVNEKNFNAAAIELPTDAEVLAALQKEDSEAKDLPSIQDVQKQNVVITKEKVSESILPPKFYPMVGPAEMHTAVFQCTVEYDQVTRSYWPIPRTHTARVQKKLMVDKTKLVRAPADAVAPPPKAIQDGQVLPSAYYLQDDIQYFPQGPEAKTSEASNSHTLAKLVEEFNNHMSQNHYREAKLTAQLAVKRFPGNKVCLQMLTQAEYALEGNSATTRDEPNRTKPRQKAMTQEEKIQNALDKTITLNAGKSTLSGIAKSLAEQTGINIVLDTAGLAEAGVTPDQAVSLHVENIKASSALKLILQPLHLGSVIEDEVLKITSQARIDQKTFSVVTYPVADLVVAIPQQVTVDLRVGLPKADPENTIPAQPGVVDFEDLIQLIVSTIEPNTWSEVGGSGAIKSYETTLSLVIRQSQKVHEEIRELLEQLRRLQDLQVALEVCTLEATELDTDLAKKLANGRSLMLSSIEAAALLEKFVGNKHQKVTSTPKVTLFNAQTVHLVLPNGNRDGFGVDISPLITADRRFVRMNLQFDSNAPASKQRTTQRLLKDGYALLIGITPAGKDATAKKLLLVTPRIIVQEEEEVRLGMKGAAQQPRMLMVTPGQSIIQEEEEELLGISR